MTTTLTYNIYIDSLRFYLDLFLKTICIIWFCQWCWMQWQGHRREFFLWGWTHHLISNHPWHLNKTNCIPPIPKYTQSSAWYRQLASYHLALDRCQNAPKSTDKYTHLYASRAWYKQRELVDKWSVFLPFISQTVSKHWTELTNRLCSTEHLTLVPDLKGITDYIVMQPLDIHDFHYVVWLSTQ